MGSSSDDDFDSARTLPAAARGAPQNAEGGGGGGTDASIRAGRYELLARLATGGMGEIFLARLEGVFGRRVASVASARSLLRYGRRDFSAAGGSADLRRLTFII